MRATFHIPDLTFHYNVNLTLIDMINDHPEYFHDGVAIASVYGCFPPSIWNGGRALSGLCDDTYIRRVCSDLNSRGIPVRLTLTNPLITEEHLGDKFSNNMLDICDNGLNECIVNSPIMEEYIRKTHPSYKLTSSTCKEIRDLDALKAELEKDYSIVVLDYNWNDNMEVLEQLPHKEKVELLVCPYCYDNCKRRGEHYRFLGAQQIRRLTANLMGGIMRLEEEHFDCPAQIMSFQEATKMGKHITPDTIYNKLAPLGYFQFKIEGRTVSRENLVESYLYYMVKPEYKEQVRKILMSVE